MQPSQVYTFTEDFKLTGQHFELCNPNGDVVYEVEGTMPLKTLCIYDTNHQEVFRLTKKLMHALPTYQFYYYGEKYGVLIVAAVLLGLVVLYNMGVLSFMEKTREGRGKEGTALSGGLPQGGSGVRL